MSAPSAVAPGQYGVLVGRVAGSREDPGASPHLSIEVVADRPYRVAVNIRSVDGSEVIALLDPAYAPPPGLDLAHLAAGPAGFAPVATGPDGQGLDYLRGGLVDLDRMRPVPSDGAPDALAGALGALAARAAADPSAVAIAFGDRFADPGPDADFGFDPERGVHDIHMMQGSAGAFRRENRVHGDGALFVRFGDGSVTAFFARFASQALATDPATGDPTGDDHDRGRDRDGPRRR